MITQMDKKEETRGTETRKKGPENVPKLTPRGSVRVKASTKTFSTVSSLEKFPRPTIIQLKTGLEAEQ